MKRKSEKSKKSLSRQLLGGTVYVALAAVVAAVTINSAVGIMGKRLPSIDDSLPFDDIKSTLPSVEEITPIVLPEIPKADIYDFNSIIVNESPEGVDSVITESVTEDTVEMLSDTHEVERIPRDLNMGFEGFIKPCDGYVSKGFSIEVPVYSSTMSDYRTHPGVDVTGDVASPVYVVFGGLITDIYDDDLYGKTVEMETYDGYKIKYSNLLPDLSKNAVIGALMRTGDELAGIGKTAICEAVESSHVHLEIYSPEGDAIDPEDLISF